MNDSAKQPLTILLVGVFFLAAYMAFRPWPLGTSKAPIRPAAYVGDILGGHPPSGAPPSQDTAAIEAGLWALIGVWAASKLAAAAYGLANGLGNLFGGGGGSEGGESGGETPPPEEAPPIEEVPV